MDTELEIVEPIREYNPEDPPRFNEWIRVGPEWLERIDDKTEITVRKRHGSPTSFVAEHGKIIGILVVLGIGLLAGIVLRRHVRAAPQMARTPAKAKTLSRRNVAPRPRDSVSSRPLVVVSPEHVSGETTDERGPVH